ncbi:MAG: crotonobetaine/carnitine-CoA ligase, partial [Parasphingorhabdus sp.]
MPKNDNLRNKQNWTVSATLKLQAQHCADKTLVRIEDQTLSYVEALHSTQRCAGWLKSLDIKKRDYVAVMLPNCIEHCLSWFSLSWLGAVHVAVNTDYRGEFLRHVLHNCACEVLIVHTDYVEEVYKIAHKLKNLKQLIIVGDAGIGLEQDANKARFTITEFSDWARTTELLEATETDYRDLACVMYTSGTTGPSKGVMMTYAHIYLFGLGTIENMALTDEDIFYIVLPLFHANAMFMQLYASMIIGASVVIRRRFSGSQWLSDVIKYRATITNSLGVVSAFILNQPESDLDRKHSLRTMGMAPNSPA